MTPFVAEFLGTAFIIIIGNGVVANVVLPKTKGNNGGLISIVLGWMIAVFVGVYMTADSSGAHLNPAVTFALALMTFIITQVSAKSTYWKHIFWMPGVPVPMKIILAPIELLGVFIKPFALMIRLYANITAGHVVLMSILGMIFIFKGWIGSSLSFGLAFALSLLELLVAALQAYIFTMLSALYFGAAVEEHHHE